MELYTNSCGLMWDNAEPFGASIVFAEHRYFGQSLPFGKESTASTEHLQYLSSEEALADYVRVARWMQQTLAASVPSGCLIDPSDIPVVTFGGSYGGMLASWARMRYPQVFAAAVASSAPIFAFRAYDYDSSAYWQAVTNDADRVCNVNIRGAFGALFRLGATAAGRAQLQEPLRLCKPVTSEADVQAAALLFINAFDSMAMGNVPYEDTYFSSPYALPPYPFNASCDKMQLPTNPLPADAVLLQHLSDAAGVFNNVSQSVPCYDLPTDPRADGVLWDFLVCTELLPEETYFTVGTASMFYPSLFRNSMATVTAHCQQRFNVTPRFEWIRDTYGSKEDIARSASNIVFTNGAYDPWHTGGQLTSLSPSLPAMLLEGSAHHTDLFFPHADDPPSVVAARSKQMAYIAAWLKEFHGSA